MRPPASAWRASWTTCGQRASSFGGSVVLLEAPEHLKDGVDVWGPVGALGLMRSVKHQFDPERRLAPGRFVGGI